MIDTSAVTAGPLPTGLPLPLDVLVLLAVAAAVLLTGALTRAAGTRSRRRAFSAARAGRPRLWDDGDGPATPAGPAPRARFVVVGTQGCSDCARTLAALRRGLATEDGVRVDHVLAEEHPGLVERFQVRTAPTVLLVDDDGRVAGVHPGPVDVDVARDALHQLARGAVPFTSGVTR